MKEGQGVLGEHTIPGMFLEGTHISQFLAGVGNSWTASGSFFSLLTLAPSVSFAGCQVLDSPVEEALLSKTVPASHSQQLLGLKSQRQVGAQQQDAECQENHQLSGDFLRGIFLWWLHAHLASPLMPVNCFASDIKGVTLKETFLCPSCPNACLSYCCPNGCFFT